MTTLNPTFDDPSRTFDQPGMTFDGEFFSTHSTGAGGQRPTRPRGDHIMLQRKPPVLPDVAPDQSR